MKIYQPNKYTEIVRVEIKNMETKEIRSVSFCETTIDEVISHVNNKLSISLIGIKTRINIRISDQEKRWGEGKNMTVHIKDLDLAIEQIKEGIPTLKYKKV